MLYKKINLFCIAVVLVVLIFSIPQYNKWMTDKIINGADYDWQLSHRSEQERLINRFGSDYAMYDAIKNTLTKVHMNDSFILVPPVNYVKAMNAPGWPTNIEPESFYYFTGFKSVDMNSPLADHAIFAVMLDNHKVGLKKILNKQTLDQIIAQYKKY